MPDAYCPFISISYIPFNIIFLENLNLWGKFLSGMEIAHSALPIDTESITRNALWSPCIFKYVSMIIMVLHMSNYI